jgi:hypothetical protein
MPVRMPSDSELEQLLTPDELLERWQIPKPTQATLRAKGLLPFILIAPRTPRYRLSAILAFLAERERPLTKAEIQPLRRGKGRRG